MARGLVITKDDKEWTFNADETTKIAGCSEFIQSLVEQEMEINEDSEEDIKVTIESSDFTGDEVEKAISYLRHHSFKPPLYGKVIFRITRLILHGIKRQFIGHFLVYSCLLTMRVFQKGFLWITRQLTLQSS